MPCIACLLEVEQEVGVEDLTSDKHKSLALCPKTNDFIVNAFRSISAWRSKEESEDRSMTSLKHEDKKQETKSPIHFVVSRRTKPFNTLRCQAKSKASKGRATCLQDTKPFYQ